MIYGVFLNEGLFGASGHVILVQPIRAAKTFPWIGKSSYTTAWTPSQTLQNPLIQEDIPLCTSNPSRTPNMI